MKDSSSESEDLDLNDPDVLDKLKKRKFKAYEKFGNKLNRPEKGFFELYIGKGPGKKVEASTNVVVDK